MIYQAIGKAVVRYGLLWVRRRYGRQLRALAALAVVGLIAGGYVASRSVEEG